MRPGFALVLAIVLGACGADGSGGGDMGAPDGGSDAAPPPALRLESPDIDIYPGQDITYCWYFRTSNTRPLAIKRWQSTMSPGSHHLIMFLSKNDVKPPGTVSTTDCGAGPGLASFPTWAYTAEAPEAELALPTDDGEGKPLAIEIAPNQAGFIQLHYTNRTDAAIKAHVVVTGDEVGEGVAYTRTAAYVTYNGAISIPPMAMGDIEAQTCNVPTTSKFWMVTTHAHKQASRTAVRDGLPATGTTVFESFDWQHPGAARWSGPFLTFASGKLTYECVYNNPSMRVIEDGDSSQTDEMCMAAGFFFPATNSVFCYNNTVF